MINDPDQPPAPPHFEARMDDLGAIHVVPQLADVTVTYDDGGTEPLELPPGAQRVTFALRGAGPGTRHEGAVIAATWGPASSALLALNPLVLQSVMPWTPGEAHVAPKGEPPVRVFFIDGTALDLPAATPCFWRPDALDALFQTTCSACTAQVRPGRIDELTQRCGCEGRIWCPGCGMPIKATDSTIRGPGCHCTPQLYPGHIEFIDVVGALCAAGKVTFTLPGLPALIEEGVHRLSEAEGGVIYVLMPGHGGKWRRARRETPAAEAARLWARIEREATARARQPYPPIRVLYADGALEFADLDAMTRCVPHGGRLTTMTAEELAAMPTSIEVELAGDDGGALATYPVGAPFQVDQRVAVIGEYVTSHNALIYVEQPAAAPGQAERWRLATTEPLLDTVRRLHGDLRRGAFVLVDELEAARALLARYNITKPATVGAPKGSEDR